MTLINVHVVSSWIRNYSIWRYVNKKAIHSGLDFIDLESSIPNEIAISRETKLIAMAEAKQGVLFLQFVRHFSPSKVNFQLENWF